MQLQVKMPENSTNHVFPGKQTTKKVTPKIFGCFEVITKVRLMF